jgi:(p)ppGpp synthase/HD superfamily hydrolase
MGGSRPPRINRKIEKAIVFLVLEIHKMRKKSKPEILHSIRVGLHLDSLGYNKDIVIAAILHDILEETTVTPERIRSKFGRKVTALVKANTLNKSIRNKVKRYKENFERCLKAGKGAMIIKAADILDNSYYYKFTPTKVRKYLLKKMQYFIKISRKTLEREPIFEELEEQYINLQNYI